MPAATKPQKPRRCGFNPCRWRNAWSSFANSRNSSWRLTRELWSNAMLNLLKDVFASFQKHKVEYLVIGGIAAVLHGVPRATFDLDILINPTLDNAQHLLAALLGARLGTAALITAEDLLAQEITI